MSVRGKAADLFALPDFWESSAFYVPPSTGESGEFFNLDIEKNTLYTGVQLALPQDGFFKLPPLLKEGPKPEQAQDKRTHAHDVDDATSKPPGYRLASNNCVFNLPTVATTPEYQVWDSLDDTNEGFKAPTFITESEPAVFDAFLASKGNPCGIRSNDAYDTLDAKSYCSSLLVLSLGRESVLFRWDADKKSFKQELPLIKVTGYTGDSLLGVTQLCIECGSRQRYLRSFVEETYAIQATLSRVALAHALDMLLAVVQDELGRRGSHIRSILQLQEIVRPVNSLTSFFGKLAMKYSRSMNDGILLPLIFDETQSAEFGDPVLRDTMREVLKAVSKPWTEFVEEWIGLKREEGIRITKDGSGKCFVKVENKTWVDDQGFELEEPDYFFDREKMPAFMPEDVAQTIFETGRNLRLLHLHHPRHPLAYVDIEASEVPKLEWQFDWESIKRVEEKALAYEHTLTDAIRKHNAENGGAAAVLSKQADASKDVGLQFFGENSAEMQDIVLASIAQLDQPIPQAHNESVLPKMLRCRLFKDDSDIQEAETDLSPHWSLIPFLSFGPLVFAQARLVNRECLRLLFNEDGLRKHIRLLKDYHLLGNGIFSSRLANALFNPDLESAERQVGVARSGGIMGLRLAGRDNWPPASSELRLALMGVLSESYSSGPDIEASTGSSSRPDRYALPCDLSFSIRELSPEEMERCLDPDSLEALDFLRLSYKPPSPLAPLMTPAILIKYDRIFKLMLRMLRMLFVVDQLFRDMSPRTTHWRHPDDAALRFRVEAHHFISSITRYFFDTGIDQPWRRFEMYLDKVARVLNEGLVDHSLAGMYSPDRLRDYHEQTLDDIMLALLLRKRQQPVLKLLEDIFAVILRFAKQSRLRALGAEGWDEPRILYMSFRKKVEVFITVCRWMSEKEGYKTNQRPQEDSILRLLLLLDISNYYSKH